MFNLIDAGNYGSSYDYRIFGNSVIWTKFANDKKMNFPSPYNSTRFSSYPLNHFLFAMKHSCQTNGLLGSILLNSLCVGKSFTTDCLAYEKKYRITEIALHN